MTMNKNDMVLLDHGSGGLMSNKLIHDTMLPAFDNAILSEMGDGAVCDMKGFRIAFSTDSYVVDPLFFPGGNIGELAIYGTVNDIAMCGGDPRFISVGMILEEGFPMSDLKTIVDAMGHAARKAGVNIVTGDTKVVPKGAADKLFINTSGIGLIPEGIHISASNARPGDKIIVSGTIADHGMTVLTQREGLTFDSPIESDTAPLNHMVKRMLGVCPDIHVMRDPTRGGVGSALNEIAVQSKVGIHIVEDQLPVKKEVATICEFLGFDPIYVANEGKLLAFVSPEQAESVLAAIKEDPYGKDACIIGEVVADSPGQVILKTRIGGSRLVSMLAGAQLPRIC